MRFLHTADWQLGMTRHFLAGDAQPRYSAARRDAVVALGALAAETDAEFVVVAGDVFEHNQLAPQVISQSLEAMRAIGIPCGRRCLREADRGSVSSGQKGERDSR